MSTVEEEVLKLKLDTGLRQHSEERVSIWETLGRFKGDDGMKLRIHMLTGSKWLRAMFLENWGD
jgi:hypothetical protein